MTRTRPRTLLQAMFAQGIHWRALLLYLADTLGPRDRLGEPQPTRQ